MRMTIAAIATMTIIGAGTAFAQNTGNFNDNQGVAQNAATEAYIGSEPIDRPTRDDPSPAATLDRKSGEGISLRRSGHDNTLSIEDNATGPADTAPNPPY